MTERIIKCKRIIDGKAYNTETSTLLGSYENEEGPGIVEYLFKTRLGAFFLYAIDEFGNFGPPLTEFVKPQTIENAQKWIEDHCSASVYEEEFGEAPEAGDPEARITLRIPESLRKKAARKAGEQGQSLNAWILRCLERGASEEGRS